MNKICPQDRMTPLIIVERNGIEIDYCPSCRGVWLDRGELEKLMDGVAQSVAQAPQAQPQQYQPQPQPQPQAPRHDPLMPPPAAYPAQPNYPQQAPPAYGAQAPYGYNGSGGYKHGRKRRGFLDDIFDFD